MGPASWSLFEWLLEDVKAPYLVCVCVFSREWTKLKSADGSKTF